MPRRFPDLSKAFPRSRARQLRLTVALMPTALTAGLIAAVFGLTACGATTAKAIPDVVGQHLDTAQDTLDTAGLRYQTVGGGALGIVVRSHWTVCRLNPAAGKIARSVTLFAARSCAADLQVVPDVVDGQLEDAREQLEAAGFRVVVRSVDGDAILVQRLWTVCDQSPAPGYRGRTVVLDVAHDCWDYS